MAKVMSSTCVAIFKAFLRKFVDRVFESFTYFVLNDAAVASALSACAGSAFCWLLSCPFSNPCLHRIAKVAACSSCTFPYLEPLGL